MSTVTFSAAPSFSSARSAALQGWRPSAASALELVPPSRRWFAGAILAAHLLGGWVLLQSDWVRQVSLEAPPVLVTMMLLADTPKAVKPPNRQPAPLDLPAPALPRLLMPAFSVAALAVAQEAPPAPALPPVAPAAAPASLAPAAPPTLAPPAAAAVPVPVSPIKQIAPNAVRYLVEPRMSVPLLSRRLGESGIVHLRILVDVRGHLKEASLRKTSGFARLDQQALQDIRSARFSPYVENGQAIEWETTALLSYEVEK
jgi:protein TonB